MGSLYHLDSLEVDGGVAYRDIAEGITMQEEVDEQTGLSQKVILDHHDEKRQPRISVKDENNMTVDAISYRLGRISLYWMVNGLGRGCGGQNPA